MSNVKCQMSNVKRIVFSVLIFSSLALFKANASSVFSLCETCNSNASYIADAISSATQNGSSNVYVMNFSQGTIKKFQTSYEPELNQTFVSEIGVDSSTLGGFNNVVEQRNNLWEAIHGHRYIPEYIAPNAYSLVGASYIQNDIFEYWNQEANLFVIANAYLISVLQLFDKIINVPLDFEITFSDGSKALIAMIRISMDGSIDFELVSATDIDGNSIPLSADGFRSGEYRFAEGGESAIQDFINAANRSGVYMCRAGSCLTGEVKFECTGPADNEHCTVQPIDGRSPTEQH